jgi:hypothetical protein
MAIIFLRISKKIKRNIVYIRNFGLYFYLVLFRIEILLRLTKKSHIKWKLRNKKHKHIENYLLSRYAHIIRQDNLTYSIHKKNGTKNVWICWWQGEENMPPIVQLCYHNICKYSGMHPVILITEKNFSEYITIPAGILNKLQEEKITITTLSDIIRACLLNKYGGIWVDATLFITQPIPEYVFEKEFFSIRNEAIDNEFVTEYQWSNFCLAAKKDSLLFQNLKLLFFEYYKEQNVIIDYLLVGYFMDIIRKSSEYFRCLFEEIPYSNPDLHTLRLSWEKEFRKDDYEKMLSETWVYKLSYKGKYELYTSDGRLTYYGYLMNLAEQIKGK